MLHVLLFISGHILQLVAARELLNGTMEFGTDYNDYIFGGYEAETHTPWMAHFGHCGGAIISDQVILTAAHCIRWGEENPKYQVKVGSDKKVYDIAKTFHNKNFDIDSNVLTGNDIALFVTKEKIRFGPSVKPICLPRKPMWGAKINLSGFGAVTTFIDEYKKLHAAKFNKIPLVPKAIWKKYVKLFEKKRQSKSERSFMKKVRDRLTVALKTLFPGMDDIYTLLSSDDSVRLHDCIVKSIKLLTKPIGTVPNDVSPHLSRQAIEHGVKRMVHYIRKVIRDGGYKNVEQRFVAFMNLMMDTKHTPLMAEVASDILMKMDGEILSPDTCQKPNKKKGLYRGVVRVPWDGTCLDVSHSSFCSGDSGGPISTRAADGKDYVLGLVAYNTQNFQAFPDACNCNCQVGEATDVDVVTRVDMYTNWIKGILKKERLSAPTC